MKAWHACEGTHCVVRLAATNKCSVERETIFTCVLWVGSSLWPELLLKTAVQGLPFWFWMGCSFWTENLLQRDMSKIHWTRQWVCKLRNFWLLLASPFLSNLLVLLSNWTRALWNTPWNKILDICANIAWTRVLHGHEGMHGLSSNGWFRMDVGLCGYYYTYPKVGGVLWRELSLAITVKSITSGVMFSGFPKRSSLTITIVTPEGPTFFCAPAKITPNWKTKNHFKNIGHRLWAFGM